MLFAVIAVGKEIPAKNSTPALFVWMLRCALLAACVSSVSTHAQGTYQQYLHNWKQSTDPLEKWVFANGQRLQAFMPSLVPGLVDHLPWEGIDNYLPHYESYVHHEYLGFSVERVWAFDDPPLFQQVQQAQARFEDAKRKSEAPETVQDLQAQARLRDAANARYMKEFEELWKQGKQKEAQELMEKRAKDPLFQPPPEYAERSRQEKELRDVEAKGLKLTMDIQASYPPLNWSLLKEVGSIKGYPIYRGVSQDVFLAVYVGPKGFRNPPAGKEPQKMQMKCFLVQAQFTPGAKYESLARQMLEKIDYDGLAKLIEP